MTKQANTPSLAATKAAAKRPSKGTITKAPQSPLEQMAAQVAATPAAPAAKPVAVALRGGAAITTVKLTGKNYRVGAAHNKDWWDQCCAAIAKGKGTAPVADMIKGGVPAIFVGYVVRRGYLAAA